MFEISPEPAIRFLAFCAVFLIMATLETLAPRRISSFGRRPRWVTNLTIVGLGALLVRIMTLSSVPIVAMTAAFWAEARGIGLLNVVSAPASLETLASVVALDFAVWVQHVAAHKVPLLWRLHRMHHADVDFDVTTALRFHPVEIGLSMLWKVAWVLMLGASPLAVLLFEIILNACAVFNHANVSLPHRLDAALRMVIVTPDMHRVHHSVIGREHNSNFGFNLSVWDRLFRTYTPQPRDGHEGMTVGLAAYQSGDPTRLGWSLALPAAPLQPHEGENPEGGL